MFGYHGWATIRTNAVDEYGDEDEAALRSLLNKLREKLEVIQQNNGTAYLDERNGVIALNVFGSHNHRNEVAIHVFQWLAENGQHSYGLLYIYDDEDSNRGKDWTNVFRVWRLALGKLEEMDDPFLSPCSHCRASVLLEIESPYE